MRSASIKCDQAANSALSGSCSRNLFIHLPNGLHIYVQTFCTILNRSSPFSVSHRDYCGGCDTRPARVRERLHVRIYTTLTVISHSSCMQNHDCHVKKDAPVWGEIVRSVTGSGVRQFPRNFYVFRLQLQLRLGIAISNYCFASALKTKRKVFYFYIYLQNAIASGWMRREAVSHRVL